MVTPPSWSHPLHGHTPTPPQVHVVQFIRSLGVVMDEKQYTDITKEFVDVRPERQYLCVQVVNL